MKLLPRIKSGFFGELFPEFALGIADVARHFDAGFNNDVAFGTFPLRQAPSADAKFLTGLSAGRDANVDAAIEGGHGDVCAEDGFPGSEFSTVNEIVVFDFEFRMFRAAHAQN